MSNIVEKQPEHMNSSQLMHSALNTICSLNQRHALQVMDYSKGFLDKAIPLAHGSHKDVASYVVYYCQLLAFFSDGSMAGLAEPAQFVALAGHKAAPSSLIFLAQGRHMELVLNPHGAQGEHDQAGIDDIQVQSLEDSQAWFSLVSGKQVKLTPCYTKQFTDKTGEIYCVN